MKLSAPQWTSLVLSVLAVSSLFLVLFTRNRPSTTERLDRSRNLVGVFHKDEVRRLTFRSGGKEFRLERLETSVAAPTTTSGDFLLYAPEREPTDGAAVDRLIAGLEFAAPVRRLDGGNLDTLGLSKPEVALEVALGRSVVRLALGKNAPSPEGAAYVAVSEGRDATVLAVVPKQVAALFRMQPDDFRERPLVRIGKNEIRELVLESPNASLRLVRSPVGFLIDGKGRADRDQLEPVWRALAQLEARRFLSMTEAETARGGGPALVVRVTASDPNVPAAVVELGGACPGFGDEVVAIARKPRARAGCVERTRLVALGVERESLFDERPFAARVDEVETLRIERGGRRLVLTRRGAAFLLREPTENAVALEAGNQRLEAVLEAPAEIVKDAELARLGLEPPQGRVVVTRLADDDKAVEETLLVGRSEPDGTLYVKRGDDGAVLALGRDAARAFAMDTTLLQSLRIVDFALSALTELELSTPERQVLKGASNGLELVEPAGLRHDGELATEAVLAFGSLTAMRFVADADDGTFGFAKPTLTARARYAADGGAHAVTLVVGRATPGGFFAKLESSPHVFVIERSVAERLGTLLVDRSAFLADPKTLARVTIVANGVTRTLERRHDELVADASSGIDAAATARLIEALETLRAEAAVHTGAARANEGFAKPVLEVRYEPLKGFGKPRSFSVGASGTPSGPASGGARPSARYARAQGVEATFLVADAKLKPIFDLF